MSATTDDLSTLQEDASFDEPLRRVSYEAGMMLGLEATRDEQRYHRRRLSRHQYWMHGYGTVAGMAVSKDPEDHSNATDPIGVKLLVSPGMGIDGLGREILIHETYCINLREWLDAQSESHLREGYSDADDLLWLKVCVRQKDCEVAAQPVLARKLNLSTDAVQPSRIADSVQLELIPALPLADDDRYLPWAQHPAVASTTTGLSTAEQDEIDNAATPAEADLLSLHARLLHALDSSGVDTDMLAEELEEGARILLAHISLEVTDINAIVVNPRRISINNLVRPFVVSASQLAWLARQP